MFIEEQQTTIRTSRPEYFSGKPTAKNVERLPNQTFPSIDASKQQRHLLVVGPDTSSIGGMAVAVNRQLGLTLGGRWRQSFFPLSRGSASGESFPRRIMRHVGHWRRFSTVLHNSDPDCVHLHTCSGVSFWIATVMMFIAHAHRNPVIMHIHGAAFDEFFDRSSTFTRALIRRALSLADRVVALSPSWRNRIESTSPRAKVAVIENAVPIPNDIPDRHHGGPCRFLMLAAMDVWKGVHDLLAACAKLSAEGIEFELILAGPAGSAGNQCSLPEKIRSAKLDRVARYIGPVGDKDRSQWLAWADVLVQPSHNEGMPLSVLEAMAAGLPIVASSVGALPEIVANETNGLLVSAKDVYALTGAIKQMAQNPEARRAMGRAARELAETKFSMDRYAIDLEQLLDGLIPETILPLPVPALPVRRRC